VSYRKLFLVLLFTGAVYLGAIVSVGLTARPVVSDLAVVLGNEILANGRPSARLQARLDCAVDLYRRHLAQVILVSGGKEKSGFDEATIMAQYLAEQGVPMRDIRIDSKGINTIATAINTSSLVRTENFSRIIIVTQYYHIARCLFAFHKEGLESLSADYPRYFEIGDLPSIVREGVALPVYFIKMSGID